jgi:predicted transcriptional regulator of viral defense system
MSMTVKFPKQLKKRLFSVKQAEELGLSRRVLQSLYESGQIERVARGVYQFVNVEFSNEDQLIAATLRMGYPSAICLVSALVQYNLTDIIPRKVWIMVPASKRTIQTDLKVLRSRSPLWEIGIVQENGYRITSLERTLADCLIYRRLVGLQISIDALKRAIQQKKTTPGKVLDIAVQLKVEHRLRPYLEVFA